MLNFRLELGDYRSFLFKARLPNYRLQPSSEPVYEIRETPDVLHIKVRDRRVRENPIKIADQGCP